MDPRGDPPAPTERALDERVRTRGPPAEGVTMRILERREVALAL